MREIFEYYIWRRLAPNILSEVFVMIDDAIFAKPVVVEEISKEIISNVIDIPCSEGIHGGFAITGFIDVEKLIKINKHECCSKVLFLEKKLPFSVVVLTLDTE